MIIGQSWEKPNSFWQRKVVAWLHHVLPFWRFSKSFASAAAVGVVCEAAIS